MLARHTYGAGKNMLIVPGGYLNKGETPEHAVKREYLEETGVLINPKDIIAVRFNLKDWYVAFSADYVSGQEHSDNDENSEVVWLDVDVALKRNDVPQLTKKLIEAALNENRAFKKLISSAGKIMALIHFILNEYTIYWYKIKITTIFVNT